MLKHIKDIRSPIAVAQQKQAARKASATDGGPAKSASSGIGQTLSPGQDRNRPPKLQVNSQLPNQPGLDGLYSQPVLSGGAAQSGSATVSGAGAPFV